MSSSTSSSRFAIYGAIGANVAIAISKFVAAFYTGSSAMLSEGIHSLVDSGNGVLILFGVHQSAKAPDKRHPFGRSKELYFWALIVAILVFSVGGGMSFYEGIKHIQHPGELGDPTWNYVILGLSILFELFACYLAVKALYAGPAEKKTSFITTLRTSKDPAVFASVLENLAALAGLVIAIVGVYLGHELNNPYFDGGGAIVIGLLLMLVAVFLVAKTKALLVGLGVDEPTLLSLATIVKANPGVENFRPPLTMYLGPTDVVLALDVDFRGNLSSKAVEETIEALQTSIKAVHPEFQHIFIEAKALAQHLQNQPAA